MNEECYFCFPDHPVLEKGRLEKRYLERIRMNCYIQSRPRLAARAAMKSTAGIIFFVSKAEFEKMINDGKMLEYAQYVDQYYGTPNTWIEQQRQQGNDVFMEIEVNGAMQVRSKVPDAILIFLLPPDLMQLRNRLELRGTESDEVINQRLKTARQEILMMTNYDYAVVNDKVDKAVKKGSDHH